jgi:hypothetical protein
MIPVPFIKLYELFKAIVQIYRHALTRDVTWLDCLDFVIILVHEHEFPQGSIEVNLIHEVIFLKGLLEHLIYVLFRS